MSILKIAKIGHPVLFQKASPIKKVELKSLKKLVDDMCETMVEADGIGLAAPQVHVNKRLIIFRTSIINIDQIDNNSKKEKIELTVLINPTYQNSSEEFEDDWEGCLSIPGMLGKVRRYKKVTYKGFNLKGQLVNKTVEGIHARIVQHECDHLNGILYISKLSNPNFFGFTEEINKYFKNEKESIR